MFEETGDTTAPFQASIMAMLPHLPAQPKFKCPKVLTSCPRLCQHLLSKEDSTSGLITALAIIILMRVRAGPRGPLMKGLDTSKLLLLRMRADGPHTTRTSPTSVYTSPTPWPGWILVGEQKPGLSIPGMSHHSKPPFTRLYNGSGEHRAQRPDRSVALSRLSACLSSPSFSCHLLSLCCVPCTILGAKNKPEWFALMGFPCPHLSTLNHLSCFPAPLLGYERGPWTGPAAGNTRL